MNTQVDKRFVSKDRGDPDYVYLSLKMETSLPWTVKLVLSSSILNNRDDYYLNTDWFYGMTSESLDPREIQTWLKKVKGPGEILFKNKIALNEYLIEIVVNQLSEDICNLICKDKSSSTLHKLDMNTKI